MNDLTAILAVMGIAFFATAYTSLCLGLAWVVGRFVGRFFRRLGALSRLRVLERPMKMVAGFSILMSVGAVVSQLAGWELDVMLGQASTLAFDVGAVMAFAIGIGHQAA